MDNSKHSKCAIVKRIGLLQYIALYKKALIFSIGVSSLQINKVSTIGEFPVKLI